VLVLRYNYKGAHRTAPHNDLAQLEEVVSGFNGIE
jgi:hypothetical protein